MEFYTDMNSGDDENDGLSAEKPKKTPAFAFAKAGDKIYIKHGCVWNMKRKIRFGNALEFRDIAENRTAENCLFYNIYDSCVTHQGGRDVLPARNVRFCGNLFSCYGMAAYEQRDVMPVNADFCGNICIGAAPVLFGQTKKRLKKQPLIYIPVCRPMPFRPIGRKARNICPQKTWGDNI